MEPTPRRSPWPYAIVAVLAIVVAVNAVYIYVAVHGADPVDPSYTEAAR